MNYSETEGHTSLNIETKVASHYGKEHLQERILEAVKRLGKEPNSLTPQDLAPMDEFHTGGLPATQDLAAQMELKPGLHILDVGSGVGGPARYFAKDQSCHVTGIDLTDEFVQAAQSLTKLLNLEHLAEFRQGNALHLSFADETFDRAYMMHVGMNMADKLGVFCEVRRVLKPGGLFAVFDVMRSAEGTIRYPLPWALTEETSFLGNVTDYRRLLEEAGFRIERERRRGNTAIEMTERAMQQMAKSGPPVVGLQLLMGEKTPIMVGNILAMMKQGLLEPVELIARA